MQKEVRFGGVAVDVEEAEASAFQLLEQAEPVPHYGRVIAAHLKARPVQVKLQQQLAHRVQNSFQDQILQNLPLRTLHIRLQYIHLEQEEKKNHFRCFFFLLLVINDFHYNTAMTLNCGIIERKSY